MERGTAARIHVQTWIGTNSARVTEMDGAYKPGARLRVLRLHGHHGDSEPGRMIALNLRIFAEELPTATSFDDAERMIRARFAELCKVGKTVPEFTDAEPTRDRDIRGVDAPREALVFNCPKWGIKADEGGISMHDDDRHNEGRQITHDQSPRKAYEIARKVWEQVIQAPTMSKASDILGAAGARLHYYCGMD
jgi:hypothetical protein